MVSIEDLTENECAALKKVVAGQPADDVLAVANLYGLGLLDPAAPTPAAEPLPTLTPQGEVVAADLPPVTP